MPEPKLSLDDLIAQIPEELQDVAKTFIPELIRMSQAELRAWILFAVGGDAEAALQSILVAMPNEEAIAIGERLVAERLKAAKNEADRRALAQRLLVGLLEAAFAILASAVVL